MEVQVCGGVVTTPETDAHGDGRISAEENVVAEAMKRIRDAETLAEEAVRQARAERKKLVAEAHESAERMLEDTIRAARTAEKQMIDEARADAEREAEKLVADNRSEVESVRAEGEGRVEAGIGRVLEALAA